MPPPRIPSPTMHPIVQLAHASAADPTPSFLARDIVADLEQQFFASDDNYTEWTPAFRRRVAQFLDMRMKINQRVIPVYRENADPNPEHPAMADVRAIFEEKA